MSIPTAALDRLLAGRDQFIGFVERRVGSRAVAEDIVQEAFLKSVERGGSVRDGESAVAWFYRVLRNAVIDYYRRSDTARRASEAWAHELERQQTPDPDTEREICRCILGVLDGLKPEYKQALEMVDLEDRSLQDLADAAGINANNAAVRVHRARQALRKQLVACCGSCGEAGCVDCGCS